ncbi:amino acid permease [Halosolutus gelatinilyticus]|uniref:amino acid permease n=1 Tax=Halosolutus gelatinilyticus TaxID=2931975 RepID=UPI001FF345F5|nr:amino acid permease [Halosolutus gelatinilyticus]
MVEHTRTLGFWVAFALGLGTMIAAGIFSLSGTAVAAIGSSAVIAFVIAALIAGVTAASYSEFASIYAENGGGYLFSSRTFDRDLLEYAVGVSLFLGYTGTTAFYLATMDEWFFEFILPHGWPVPHGTIGVLAAILLGSLNARGTEESGTFQVLVSGAKVAVLIAFIAGAFAYKAPAETVGTFTAAVSTDVTGIVSIAALAFITFFGFSAIAASAGEIIEPRKTVPRAIAASIVAVTILYAFVIVAMVNAPIPAEVIAEEGETAMGSVANAFLGSIGMALIVAGAIFSMVSASNASVLAASSIGSLMGRQGQAPRRFSRIHPVYGTPFWSVTTVTATIVTLIVGFIMLFPAEGGLGGMSLGLEALTGFATFNLLAPLSVVNIALIVSRRRFPDIERPIRVPLVPLVPIIGILANLALITNLPTIGVVVGTVLVGALLAAYLIWGGAPETEELFERVVSPYSPDEMAAQSAASGGGSAAEATPIESTSNGTAATDADRFRLLVPVRRPDRAPAHVRLAATIGSLHASNPLIRVVNVTQIPDQTPSEMVTETAEERASRIGDVLAAADIDVDYTVEGHISRDVGFSIVQAARNEQADLILMGYPEESADVTQRVEFDAPCDVLFSSGFIERGLGVPATVNVGAGGGPHHEALLPFVNDLAEDGSKIHVINVRPTGEVGTAENPGRTLNALPAAGSVEVHNVTADSVAEGLVTTAVENGGILVIGASRTRRLRQWILGSTPDRVIDLADDADVPVIVYASEPSVRGVAEDLLFPIYRYLAKLGTPDRPVLERERSGDVER